MTENERVQGLHKFGYDGEEARFLSTAAFHSGYFLRRQFLSFIHGTKGWKDIALLQKLEVKAHSRAHVFRHERKVYHLSSKALYEALGDPNNRNRREHQPATIKNRIMALDFVLDHSGAEFLATERQKLDYFLEARKIPREDLPTKFYASPYGHAPTTKHFVERYPIFLGRIEGKALPHFVYIDEGLQSTDRFATFLSHYRRLLCTLGDFRIIYVAEDDHLFASAERVFRKLLQSISELPAPAELKNERMLAYFRRRRAYEARDFSEFDTADLIQFREEKQHFAGEPYERLFADWKARQDTATSTVVDRNLGRTDGASAYAFSTYILHYDYDLFGTLTSKNHKPRNAEIPTELLEPVVPGISDADAEVHGTKSERQGQDHADRR